MSGLPPGPNQYQQQPNYPRGPYQGPPVGGNYPRGQYPGAPMGGPQPYGAPYNPQNPYGQTSPLMGVTPGLVTAGFIMALIPCTAKIGLIMCAIGMGEAKKRQAGEGLALAGIIIGAVWLLILVIGYVALGAADVASSSSSTYRY